MLIRMRNSFVKRILSQRGSGIAVVVFGVVVMLVFIFLAMNIMNAGLIEQGYNNLRDAVMSASTGSVIHLLLEQNSTQAGLTQMSTQNTTITYDPYLQLALGYIINYDNIGANINSSTIGIEKNNFIKLDHKRVINSTLQLLKDNVLNGADIGDTNKYQILMFFIEPNYNDIYKKSFNVIWYTNGAPNTGIIEGPIEGNSMQGIYDELVNRISSIVNTKIGKNTNYRIELNSQGLSDKELVHKMETRPYYLIVVKDFALPTIFGVTTQDDGSFLSLFGNSGRLSQPMCALQAGQIERKIN